MSVILGLWLFASVAVAALKMFSVLEVTWLVAFLPLLFWVFFLCGMAAESSEQMENE